MKASYYQLTKKSLQNEKKLLFNNSDSIII
jgi:hypothetical protein